MTADLPAIFVVVTSLVGALLVFSGFRLYRVGLATVGAVAGSVAGWYVGGYFGPSEAAAAAALLGGVAGAVLAGALEVGLRFVAGGIAAAALTGLASGGVESGTALSVILLAGAFLVGGVTALLIHRPLVISAFAICGGLLVAAAGVVAREPGLVHASLGETAGSIGTSLGGDLLSALAVIGGSVAAAFVLQAGEGRANVSGRRPPGVRGGGVLVTAVLAAGLALTLHPADALPGPALAITGIGPLSWTAAVLLLKPAVGWARRRGPESGLAGGWLLAAAFGLVVGLSDTLLAASLPGDSLAGTGFLAGFLGDSDGLRWTKAGWSLVAFPLLFYALSLGPATRSAGQRDGE